MSLHDPASWPSWLIYFFGPLAMLLRTWYFLDSLGRFPQSWREHLLSTFSFHVGLLVAIIGLGLVAVIHPALPQTTWQDYPALIVSLGSSWGVNYWFLRKLLSNIKHPDS